MGGWWKYMLPDLMFGVIIDWMFTGVLCVISFVVGFYTRTRSHKLHKYLCLLVACTSQVPDFVSMCDTDEKILHLDTKVKKSRKYRNSETLPPPPEGF